MNNKKSQEIIKIQKQSDTNCLRNYLKHCESEILSLAYKENDRETVEISDRDKILKKVEIRCALLNRLFELNFSEANYQDLVAINNRLVQMENKALDIHKNRYKQFVTSHSDYKLDTFLSFCYDDNKTQLIVREDDGFYSSQWNYMIKILSRLSAGLTDDLYGCCDYITDGHKFGSPYKEPCEIDIALPKAIPFCYTLCKLCNQQYYSIPDIMRMTTYRISQTEYLEQPIYLHHTPM